MRLADKTDLSTGGNVNESLKWEVFVTPGIPVAASDLPPGTKQLMWSPISSALIYGKREAVLVDAFITVEQADALVDWVAASGKNLTTIYATHGHGGHFFGIGALLDRFPNSRAVATSDVVKVMRQQPSPQSLASFWNPFFSRSDFQSSCDCRRTDRKRD
jgi:glyoxylase-like metal-dependent hydrolase (beta-lactamase superfamily II)